MSLRPIALVEPLGFSSIVADAPPLQKLVMLALALAMIAALVVAARKATAGRRLSGGSAFVSGLRLGGPVIGGLGAAYRLMDIAINIANQAGEPTAKLLAPGIAEAGFMLWLGFLAGAVGVIANWSIESRIDRQVLAD